MASTDAHPIPLKGVAYRVTFPILDADGDLVTGATGLDSEISKDGGTFTDCGSEATEIATASGMYFLDLTGTEMTADTVAIIVKTTSSGAKTTPIVLYPQEADDIRVAVTHWVATAVATVDTAGYPKVTVKAGTGTGEINLTSGVADANVTKFGGSNGTFASGRPEANMSHIAGSLVSTSSAQLGVNVIQAAGTAWGAGAITAASIAADAITDAKVAADVTIASVTGAVGSVIGNVGGNVTGSVGSLATQAKADVNAEVVDALNVDTYAEPGQGAPPATASLADKLNYIFKAWRNKKTQTATDFNLFGSGESGSTVDQKATLSDDGSVFTAGEIASGP